jgi:hypothetical protein
MSICVECVSYVAKRTWAFLIPEMFHYCAHPENMKSVFDYVTGKAKLAHCYVCNKNGCCEWFIKKGDKI